MDEDFRVETQRNGDLTIVRPVGDLDLSTSQRLVVATAELAGEAIVMDLAAVEFVDSSGLRTLIEAHQMGAKLTNPSQAVRRLFEITALDSMLSPD